jgi:alkylation response protein AidB-like acyl-CoA dehydrogenase
MRNFQHERLALAFYGHSTAAIVLEDAIEYAKQRQAFGRPIVGFQVTRHKLARMAMQVSVARTFNYSIAQRVVDGEYLVGSSTPRTSLPRLRRRSATRPSKYSAAWASCAKHASSA